MNLREFPDAAARHTKSLDSHVPSFVESPFRSLNRLSDGDGEEWNNTRRTQRKPLSSGLSVVMES